MRRPSLEMVERSSWIDHANSLVYHLIFHTFRVDPATNLTNTIPLPPHITKKLRRNLPSPSLSTPLFIPFLEEYNKFPPNTHHWVTTSVSNELYGVGKPSAWEPTVLVDVLQEWDKDNYLVLLTATISTSISELAAAASVPPVYYHISGYAKAHAANYTSKAIFTSSSWCPVRVFNELVVILAISIIY